MGIAHLSTGELFRQEMKRRSALGRSVERYVTHGRLVPDALVVKVMTHRLTPGLLARGIVLDGFPRTVGQAKGLDAFLKKAKRPLDGAVYLDCSASVLVARLSGRQVCGRCGAIYHVRRMPPKRSGVCDHCGGTLVVRPDDQVATIKKRLAIDHAESKQLLAYYRGQRVLFPINGNGTGAQAFARAMKLFRREDWLAATGPELHDATLAARVRR